jgi:hypothetical protein
VELFRLHGAASSEVAFAWSKVESGHLHCYVVLKDDATACPEQAVRRLLDEKLAQQEYGAAA